MTVARELDEESLLELMSSLREWAKALGFSQIGVADVDLSSAEPGLLAWLSNGFHGSMGYMAAHGLKRARPAELVPGTVRPRNHSACGWPGSCASVVGISAPSSRAAYWRPRIRAA